MIKMNALPRLVLVMAITCLIGFTGKAKDTAELIAALDEIDREITESRELSDRSSTTLEELRNDLYRSAVQTRDAKRLASDAEKALKKGDEVTSELLTLQKNILNAGSILRDVNNQIKQYVQINNESKDRISDLEKEVESLKLALVDPSEAKKAAGKRLVASMKADLKKADELIEQRGRIIERLNKKIADLKDSSGVDVDMIDKYEVLDPNLAKADTLLNEGRIEDALKLYNKTINSNPDSNEARLGIASCYFESGEYALSRRMIEEVQNRDKNNPRAMGLMGALYYHEGNSKKARKLLEKAVRLEETNAYNLNSLGVLLFEAGRQDDGIERVQQAVDIDPSYISARYNLSVMLASIDEPDLTSSKVHYQKAIGLGGPRDPIMDRLLGLEADAEAAP